MNGLLPIQDTLPQSARPQISVRPAKARNVPPVVPAPVNLVAQELAKFDIGGLTEAGVWPEYQRALRALLQAKAAKDRNPEFGAAFDPAYLSAAAATANKVRYADGTKPAWLDEINDILAWNQKRFDNTNELRRYAEWNNQPGNRRGEAGYMSFDQWRARNSPNVQAVMGAPSQPAPQMPPTGSSQQPEPQMPPTSTANVQAVPNPTSIARAYRRGLLNRV